MRVYKSDHLSVWGHLPNNQAFYCRLAGWRNVGLPVAAAGWKVMRCQPVAGQCNKLCSK